MNHRNFEELRKRMSPDQRARNERDALKELEEMLLSQLRRATGRTQSELAKAMGVKQPQVSKLKSQNDMQISTLRAIVEALGGQLEIVADLPKRRIALSQFRDQK